jgi:Acyl-CoA dehydrogenase, C-terminal domain
MRSRLMTARLAAYHAAHLLDRRQPCDAELMNAKLVNTESALTSARTALEIFAGRGCQRDHHIERYLCDVIHTFPAAGTSDVQRLRLAEVDYQGIQASFPRCTKNRPKMYQLSKYGLPPRKTGWLTGVTSWRNNMGRGYSAQFLDSQMLTLIRVNRAGPRHMPARANDEAAWVAMLCVP